MNTNINHSVIENADIIRPTHVEVYLQNLKHNYDLINNYVGSSVVMPILKANAYGHGLLKCAKLYQSIGAEYIGVAVLEEGILLRKNGINIPILVLGGILDNQLPYFIKNNLTITASSIEKLQQIDDAAKQLNTKAIVHLKVDTGMERIGVHYYNSMQFFEKAISCKNITVEGVYSHFANSEESDKAYTLKQIERFNNSLKFFESHSYNIKYKHISNSGGILQYPEANFNMVRPGILLYGAYPSSSLEKSLNVKSCLSWKSRVVYFKVIKPNHPVGYGSTWQTDKNIRAVTIPVGYGDGYLRSMSDKAEVIIRGKRFPVIGTISMDQIVVNIEADSAYNGDEVILLGENDKAQISIEEAANWAGTIPYEILTNINTRVPRVYK